jgi:hypothetical protein
MAEILFRSRDSWAGGEWKLGDIVSIQEDGHQWSLNESKSVWIAGGKIAAEFGTEASQCFLLIKLPGVAVATVLYLLEAFPGAGAGQGKQRLWKVDFSRLTQTQINNLLAKGEVLRGVDMTDAAIKDKVRNKQTDAAATW